MSSKGVIPEYVPPHLQGKVSDFRNEGGGVVSFEHPDAALGIRPDLARVRLSPQEYKATFDRAYRLADIENAVANQHAPTRRHEKTTARRLNEGIAGVLRKTYDWGTSTQGKGVATAGLLSALAGAAGGYVWGSKTGTGKISKALLLALLAGTAGAGATAWSQGRHNRREAWLAKHAYYDPSYDLIRLLEGDPTISGTERARILRAASRLRGGEQAQLLNLLRTVSGAGAGILAMRFLGAKGLLSSAVGGILGGLLGGRYL